MTISRLLVVTAVVSLLASCVVTPDPVMKGDPTETVNNLMGELEFSLMTASQEASEDLELSEITITLKTVVSDEKGGGLSILIFKIGQKKKDTVTTEFTIKMTKAPTSSSQTSTSVDKFVDALKDLVSNAKHSLAGLSTSEVTGTLKFALLETSTGDVGKKWEVVPIGISASRNLTSTYTHSVKIVFKKNTKQKSGKDEPV